MIFLCFGDHPQCLPLGVEGTLDEGGLRVDDGLLGLVNGVLDVNGRDVVDRGTAANGGSVDGSVADKAGDGVVLLDDVANLFQRPNFYNKNVRRRPLFVNLCSFLTFLQKKSRI